MNKKEKAPKIWQKPYTKSAHQRTWQRPLVGSETSSGGAVILPGLGCIAARTLRPQPPRLPVNLSCLYYNRDLKNPREPKGEYVSKRQEENFERERKKQVLHNLLLSVPYRFIVVFVAAPLPPQVAWQRVDLARGW